MSWLRVEKRPEPMDEMQQWVSWYESQGLTYFPLYGITNGVCRCSAGSKCGENTGKHPIYKWKDKPSRIPGPLDNIAINTNNLVVLDFDRPDAIEAIDDYPATFTTTTGRGIHLWYRADPSKEVKSVAGWKPKVDIRAKGGLLVAPPSRHRHGLVYKHLRGDTIVPIPADLLAELPEKGSAPNRRIGYEVDVVLSETHPVMRPLGSIIVREMQGTTENRNQTLFRLGCRFFEQAATGLLGADVLEELIAAAIETGLTPDEVQRTLDSARKSV